MFNSTTFRCKRLNIEDYPLNSISKAYLEIVGDGLSCDILIPMIIARGKKSGPVFGLSAAVHGNELNGIRVIHDLFRHLDVSTLSGTLIGVICVNVPGLHSHEREIYHQYDLNHMFPGIENGNVVQVYAYRIIDRIIKQFDYLVDLHTASFGRVNSLYVRTDLENEITRRMAFRQRPQIILHSLASDTTLRGAAMEIGIPSITIEIGDPQKFQNRYIKSTRAGIWDILADAKMIPRKARKEVDTPILCNQSEWVYTDMGGLLEVLPELTSFVQKGEVIGILRNAFGEIIREFVAPDEGIIIGKSVNPVSPTGSRIVHLGKLSKTTTFKN